MMNRQQDTSNDLHEGGMAEAELHELDVEANASKSNDIPMASTVESEYDGYGQNYNSQLDDDYVAPSPPHIRPQVPPQNTGHENYGGLQPRGAAPVAVYYGAPPPKQTCTQPKQALIGGVLLIIAGVIGFVLSNSSAGAIFVLLGMLLFCYGLVTCDRTTSQ